MAFTDSDSDGEEAPQQQLRQPPAGLRNEDLPALFWCGASHGVHAVMHVEPCRSWPWFREAWPKRHCVSKLVSICPPLPRRCRDELPEGASEHPDAAAIQAILEDTTPEEQAEGFKVQQDKWQASGMHAWQPGCTAP